MKSLALIAFLLMTAAAHSTTWDLNDVTYILPLPLNLEANQTALYLSPEERSSVDSKELIPWDFYQKIVPFHLAPGAVRKENQMDAHTIYSRLRALAFRIDPCFKDRFADRCHRQIRVVWQPITTHLEKTVVVDASIHTFYELNERDFNQLAKSLETLKTTQTRSKPLGIHPALTNGMRNEFGKKLMQTLRQYITFTAMTRIAEMDLHAFESGWKFQGFDVVGGRPRVITIPLVNMTEFSVENIAGAKEFNSNTTLEGLKDQTDQFFSLMDQSKNEKIRNNLTLVKGFRTSALRVENPSNHLPGTIDCVTCHMANSAKAWTNRRLMEADGTAAIERTFTPKGNYNLQNTSKRNGNTRMLRALGYFEKEIQLSDRVINETAAVADAFNAQSSTQGRRSRR